MIFLAADIGGTRARLLIGETEAGGSWRVRRQETLACADFPGMEALLARFLRPREGTQVACLALAGPVDGDGAKMTNLPWLVDAQQIARRFALRRVHLINDFVGQAHGLSALAPSGVHTLQAGEPLANAPRLLIGAGTGLGIALVVGSTTDPVVLPSEGGHADFAPADEQQMALVRYLRPQFGRVSLETVLSGHGLERIHGFLAGRPGGAPPLLTADGVSAAALAGEPAASASLALFARIYASAAGNLALTALPRGGVFLCGGIAPKILPFLVAPETLTAFQGKPPMADLLRRMPLHVITDEHLGLWGAAKLAARLEPTS